MQKVTFKAKVKMPKMRIGPMNSKEMEEARTQTQVDITIKGLFTTEEAGVLELLLKSWHRDKK